MFRLLFLCNGWADCVEIWYALGNPLASAYAAVTDVAGPVGALRHGTTGGVWCR